MRVAGAYVALNSSPTAEFSDRHAIVGTVRIYWHVIRVGVFNILKRGMPPAARRRPDDAPEGLGRLRNAGRPEIGRRSRRHRTDAVALHAMSTELYGAALACASFTR